MLRPMTSTDADTIVDLMHAAWGVEDRALQLLRVRHLIATDPGGAWVAVEDGTVVGSALALVREGLWGLSLLIVRADRQSAGIGRDLMDAATAYGADRGGGIILSSEDPRALRTYWRAGYELRPVFDAAGTVRTPPKASPHVRAARWPQDRELVDAASRAARGAAHGSDIDIQLEQGRELLVHDDGGYVFRVPGRVPLLAASDPRVARELLETVLSDSETLSVDFLDARQDWAIDTVLEAGLELKPSGATCVRGHVGPMRPYVPSGAYL
jgi:GNAT superfamily N-acetyltransferase